MAAYDGDTLRRAREWARLTQEQLGERVGSPRSVSRWEAEGISSRSPYFTAVEQALRLKDPLVLRAIRNDPPEDTPAASEDPRALPDGALLAQLDTLLAELKRRFWERGQGTPVPLRGQHAPYPSHLDPPATTQERSRTGD